MRNRILQVTAAAALFAATGCTVHQQTAPSVSGPSEQALSLKLFATPDRLVQDGLSTSKISVIAYDPTGHPIATNVHLDILVNGSVQSFGTLSSSNVTTSTDASNPVSVTYTPPATTTGNVATVSIAASSIGTNSSASSPQLVSMVVSPATAVASVAPTAVFNFSPSTVTTGRAATFDASSSCGGQITAGVCSSTSAVTTFNWDFGDNSTGTGQIANHIYAATGTYTVTLTVTNDKNQQAAATKAIVVTTAVAPTSTYIISPTTIHKNVDTVNFNAAASAASSGHSIVRYDWNFGDGTTASTTTANAAHIFTAANTYKTTLTVTDDLGQSATSEQDVIVLN